MQSIRQLEANGELSEARAVQELTTRDTFDGGEAAILLRKLNFIAAPEWKSEEIVTKNQIKNYAATLARCRVAGGLSTHTKNAGPSGG